jgi:hypothetical protein
MAQEIITLEDLQKFRLQLLEDLRGLLQQPNHSQKQWLKSSEVRKRRGIPIAIGTHGTLQNLRIKNVIPYLRIGGLMFYKYDDIIKLFEAEQHSPRVRDT